jgi:hypothetical protein
MRSRRVAPVLFFLLLAGLLLGSGAAAARPAQDRPARLVLPALTPSAATRYGHHCNTRRDPVAPDRADL